MAKIILQQGQSKRELIADWPNSVYQKWAAKYCWNNLWRFRHYLGEFDDCMAEAAYIYCWCRDKYGPTVNTNAQFMSLYKKAIFSWFTDHSNDDTRFRNIAEAEAISPSVVPSIDLEKLLVLRTDKSSEEVKEVVKALLTVPADALSTIGSDLILAKNFLQKVFKKAGIKQEQKQKVEKELRKALGGL